ncbi:MAG: hypothetical protein AMJ75_00330 [Phycisphaerae bacterium SM1_79]|nr:MAG: hypothetical protein AMJ75_00330 [Phycisphaerae bacterium SM1_79]
MDCPNKEGRPFCCQNCAQGHSDALTDDNKSLWSKADGFWSEKGCKLPREERPEACRTYDCRRDTVYVEKRWFGGRWHDLHTISVPSGHELKVVPIG